MPPTLPPLLPHLFLFLIFTPLTTAHTCTSSSSCPPFTSPLPYPFSSTPGCGHPNFQIRCSSPQSFISINNVSFTILRHQLNSSSLHLSFLTTNQSTTSTTHSLCPSSSFSSLLNKPINLSSPPFRFSEKSCSDLSSLKPCPPLHLPNCTLCFWECDLLRTPVHLFQGCQPNHHIDKTCKQDVLSYLNHFLKSGFQLQWDKNDSYFDKCTICQAQNGVCGFNSSDPTQQFLCYHSTSTQHHRQQDQTPPWIRRDNPNRIVLLTTLFICTCLLVAVLVVTFLYRLKLRPPTNEEDPSMLFLHRHRSANLLPPVFSYEELESSTNRFDPRRKIGDGGFGSVYLGQLYDGRIVAVKKLHHRPEIITRAASTKSFCNEILILSSIEHPNLVKLHGYCSDARGLLLVYDYVPNGTLADHLHGSKSFYKKDASLKSWQVRVEVALQTAMALEYLHFFVEPAIVHRDITSSNIFVEKDMRIKVGDFGLSRLLVLPDPSSSSASCGGYICTGPQGTPGYLDPDYHRSFRLTQKSDVYSFGVVLFELISGMKAVDLSRDKREVALADLVVSKIQVGSLHQVVDPVLIVEGNATGTVDAMAELAFRCVAADKDDRPDAKEVVAELKRIRNCASGYRSSNALP